jgi:hypothetical protein
MNERHAVAADHVFDPPTQRRPPAVVIESGNIVAVVPQAELSASMQVDRLPAGGRRGAPRGAKKRERGGGGVLK